MRIYTIIKFALLFISAIYFLRYCLYVYFNVKDFGAVGDGVTDDTLAIQRAISENYGMRTIYFPIGVYKITSTINVDVNAPMRMVGSRMTIIRSKIDCVFNILNNKFHVLVKNFKLIWKD